MLKQHCAIFSDESKNLTDILRLFIVNFGGVEVCKSGSVKVFCLPSNRFECAEKSSFWIDLLAIVILISDRLKRAKTSDTRRVLGLFQ